MANLDREKSLYYECSRNDSSIGYARLPEISTQQGVYPISSEKWTKSCHANNVSNEGKTAAATELTLPLHTHPTPPPAYQSESCESPRDLARLEPLRSKFPSVPYTSQYEEESRERQKFPFWRKKRGIILTVVLSNLVIIGIIFVGVLVSRHVASHSASSTEAATKTEGYTSSTIVTILPATTMSASPIQWGPNSDGAQASGSVTDSGGSQDNSDAAGESVGASGPLNSPGGGGQ